TPILLNSGAATPSTPQVREPSGALNAASSSPRSLSNRPPAPASAASVSPELARLEAWLHKVDRSDPTAQDMEDELDFLLWSLPPTDFPQAWVLREGLQSPEVRKAF